jgi:DNA (cytosine-5)-methyltransferase 1
MRAVSLFSGCGGDTLGMTQAGVEVIGYCELEKLYCESHDANFKNCKCIGNDITLIKKFDFEADILFSGSPCQSYSNAGKKNKDDPRGQLYLHFVRAINDTNPKVIIMENVKGLLTRKTTDGTLFIDTILGSFSNYNLIYKIFKCSDLGIPQDRERLIILGIRKDLGVIPVFPENPKIKCDLTNIVKFDTFGMMEVPEIIFKDIPDECILTDLDNEDVENNVHPYLRKRLVETDVHFNGKFISEYGFSFGKRISPVHCEIIDIRKPCKTIICTYEHAPRLFVAIKNKNGHFLRPLNVNELKQIQGFGVNYIIQGSIKKQIIQIGNAVPSGLIKAVVLKVKELIYSN